MILDTIILCIDLGIPLKDLKTYVNADGEFEFEHLLKDGKKLANRTFAIRFRYLLMNAVAS